MTLLDRQELAKQKRERDIRLGKIQIPTAKVLSFPTITPPVVVPITEQSPEPTNVPVNESSSTVLTKEEAIAEIKRGVSALMLKLKDLQDQSDDIEIAHSLPGKAVVLTVGKFYGLPYREMVSKCRHQAVVIPRQIAMYLLRTVTARSYPEIGRVVGNRDHTTAIHAHQKIERLIQIDPALAADVAQLRSLLEARNV